MRRRTFIALLSGVAVVGSLDARAQQSQPPLIAVLEGASAATMADRYDAFRAGLRALGYVAMHVAFRACTSTGPSRNSGSGDSLSGRDA